MDHSPPGSSVPGILQEGIPEWVAMPRRGSPGDLPDPGIEPTYFAAPGLQVDSLLLSYWGSPISSFYSHETKTEVKSLA